MHQSIGDVYEFRQGQAVACRPARRIMKRHGFYDGIWETPQAQEIGADLRMMRLHLRQCVIDRGWGFVGCCRKPRGKHHLAHVMQHAPEKRFVGFRLRKFLAKRHRAGGRCRVEAVLPEALQTETFDARRHTAFEDTMTQNECAKGIQSEVRDGAIGRADRCPRSEERRIDQLYDIGGHRDVARDDFGGVGNGCRGPLQARQYLLKRLWRARQRVDAPNQLREPVAAQQLSEHEGLRNSRLEGPALAGLGKVLVRGADRAHDRAGIGVTRQHQAHRLRMEFLDFGQQLPAVHAGHAHVGYDHVRRRFSELFEGSGAARGELHAPLVPHLPQGAAHGLQNIGFIIDEYDANHAAACFTSAVSSGSRMKNVVPLPDSVSKRSVPPCLLTTTLRAMASPCPVPFPTSLVVKKGSKILSRAASGMPVPVSPIEISTASPSSRVRIVILPRAPVSLTTSAIACDAFTSRFRTTWLISPR